MILNLRVISRLLLCLLISVPGLVAAAPPTPQIDGLFEEWDRDFEARADGAFLYVRFTLPDKVTPQGAPYPIRIVIDLDDDAKTRGVDRRDFTSSSERRIEGQGKSRSKSKSKSEGLGEDLVVTFSPGSGGGARGSGVGVSGPGVTVGGAAVSPSRLQLVFAPITESRSFELRLARPDPLSAKDATSLSLRLLVGRGAAAPAWRSEVLRVPLPPRATTDWRWSEIPARGGEGLRFVSWNVLFARPLEDPEPFARILRALEPDIVLLQEWEKVDDLSLAAWFDRYVPQATPWHALTSSGWGVALVSRTPLQRLGKMTLERPSGAPADEFRPDQSLRMVAARTETALGLVDVASVHLRCCGYAGSWQDRARVAEVTEMHKLLEASFGPDPTLRVVGGDFNLVGSREPLAVLSTGLGLGGGDLRPSEPSLMGDRASYTWRSPHSRFTPGRLDWLLFDPATAMVVESFVFDSRGLQAGALFQADVALADSDASDHLAVVMDLSAPRP